MEGALEMAIEDMRSDPLKNISKNDPEQGIPLVALPWAAYSCPDAVIVRPLSPCFSASEQILLFVFIFH